MYTKQAELKAGIVVLIAIAALLSFLYFAGGSESVFGDYRYVHLRFEPGFIAPKVGDTVYMNGASVGRVAAIDQKEQVHEIAAMSLQDRSRLRVGSDQEGEIRELYILAVIKMPAEVVIPKGTTAQIEKSLTGSRTLSLMPGQSIENLSDAETVESPIPAGEAVGLEDVMETVNELIVKVGGFVDKGEEVMIEIRALVANIREKVDAIDAEQINVELQEALKSIRRTVGEVESRIEPIANNIDEAASNLNRLTSIGAETMEEVREDLGEILDTLKTTSKRIDQIVESAGPKIDTLLDDLNRTGKNVASLSADFQGLGPDVRAIVADAGVDLDLFLKTINDMARNLMDASEDLRAHPWKLLNEPEKDEIAFENLRSAMLNYSRAMRDLDEVTKDLKSILARPDVDSPQVRARLESAMAEFRAAMERSRATEKRFRQVLQQNAGK